MRTRPVSGPSPSIANSSSDSSMESDISTASISPITGSPVLKISFALISGWSFGTKPEDNSVEELGCALLGLFAEEDASLLEGILVDGTNSDAAGSRMVLVLRSGREKRLNRCILLRLAVAGRLGLDCEFDASTGSDDVAERSPEKELKGRGFVGEGGKEGEGASELSE